MIRPGPDATPEPIPVDLAALRATLERIRDRRCPPSERLELLAGLPQARFDHPEAYAFLEAVLREGSLDRYPQANEVRRQAYLALGGFGGHAAAESLLSVPLRRGEVETDAASYRHAVARLREPGAIAYLAQGLASGARTELAHERRHAGILGLGDLAHPAAAPGLIALFESRRLPDELRRDAARVAGRCGDPRSYAPLEAGLSQQANWRVRQGSAWGLGGLAASVPSEADACVAALSSATDTGQPLVDEAAIAALGQSRARAAVDPLLDLLDDQRSGVRRLAHRSLCFLAGEEPAGVRSAEEWRAYWGAQPSDGLPERSLDELDLTSFRDLPRQAGGVVFVVDASGSMRERFELARHELGLALERCGPETRFQFLFFSDAPKALWRRRGLAPANVGNRRQALAWAERQRAHEVAQTGLSRAFEEALRYPEADTIYLISDAILSREDYFELRARVDRWNRRRARPVSIHAIHLRDGGAAVRWEPRPPADDVPEDVDFMHRLAWENGGVYAHN